MKKTLLFAGCILITAQAALGQTQVDPEWVYRWGFSTTETDLGDALACDQLGNIYVAGHTDTLSPHDDWVVFGLDSAGDSLWTGFYDSPNDGIDTPEYIEVDNEGNIYVTGDCGAASMAWEMNIVTIKYDSLGNRLWTNDYNSIQSMDDRVENFALDNAGFPVLVGYSEISGGKDYLIIKLQSDGDTAWVRTMPTANGTFDRLYGVAFDALNNIYVTGGNSASGSDDIAIIKYTPSGDTLWMRIYNGLSSLNDLPYGIGLDDSGYVYVGGYTNNATKDFLALKYDSLGNFIWDFVYDGNGNGLDNIKDMIVDSDGNVYMLGETTDGGQRDFLLTKTTNAGVLDWYFQYDAGGLANEIVFNSKNLLNVDSDGNVYFGGGTYYVPAGATNTNTMTFKLDPDGNIVWFSRYGGPGIDFDQIKAVTLDDDGNCYVTGYSDGLFGNWDVFVLKYPAQTGGGCSYTIGDINYSGNLNGLDVTYGVAYLKGGPAPPYDCECTPGNTWYVTGDVNGSCGFNGLDITYLVSYFKGGPGLLGCPDCLPVD